MKIKDNLDLSGYILQNFCVDNFDDLQKASKGVGRMLFFTGNSSDDRYGHVCVYDGDEFKAFAYAEDVANNKAFQSLEERVKYLEGDLDVTDTINNLKDLEAFLAGFYESNGSLMDYLNTELGKKLNTSGGTITGNIGALKIKRSNGNSSAIHFQNIVDNKDNDLGGLGFGNDGKPYVFSPDYSTKSEILTSAGGAIDGNLITRSHLITHEVYPSADDTYELGNNSRRWANIKTVLINGGTPIHSGNVGDYALKTDGSNAMQGGVKFDTFNIDLNVGLNDGIRLIERSASNGPNTSTYWNTLSVSGKAGGFQIAVWPNAENTALYFRKQTNGGTYTDWKTIAFTDSAENIIFANEKGVEGTTTEGEKHLMLYLSNANNLLLGYHTALAGINTKINGNNVYLNYGINHTTGLLLNSSGNVTIGGSDLAGASAKLTITGDVRIQNTTTTNGDSPKLYLSGLADPSSGGVATGPALQAIQNGYYGRKRLAFFQHDADDYTTEKEVMSILPNGNVLIGATADDGSNAKLQVNGGISLGANAIYGVQGNKIITSNIGELYFGTLDTTALETIVTGKSLRFRVGANANNVMYITEGGNVGIGTSNPTEKLDIEGGIRVNGHIYPKWGNNADLGKNSQRWNNIFAVSASFTEDVTIVGNLHVNGNIIADGEVSAGGAGEEGGGSSSGGGGNIVSIPLERGSDSYDIAHNLGTWDVIVSIYEQNSNDGSWDMILTDVAITSADTINVSFGSATTENHKVVIMGAVA